MAKASNAQPEVPSAAPVESAPVTPEVAESEAFVKGGRFSYVGHPRCKGREEKLKYLKAVYVDNNGQEYDARISPLPLNKGNIIEGPNVENFAEASEKIAKMPFETQCEALDKLNREMQQRAKYLMLGGRRTRLKDINGNLFKTVLVQDEITKENRHCAVADMLVNFSREAGIEDWKCCGSVMHKSEVPMRSTGNNPIHFKLA